jgi:hypothetical protein
VGEHSGGGKGRLRGIAVVLGRQMMVVMGADRRAAAAQMGAAARRQPLTQLTQAAAGLDLHAWQPQILGKLGYLRDDDSTRESKGRQVGKV